MVPATAIALLSMATLALEVLLVRAFSVILWHHFAAMVISMALLGYGMSGTLLSFIAARLKPVLPLAFAAAAIGFAVVVLIALSAVDLLPLNVLELVWAPRQALYLVGLYLLLSLPFLCAATGIGLALTFAGGRVGFVYRSDLLGAAAGAVGIIAALFVLPIAACIKVVAAVAILAAPAAVRTRGAVVAALSALTLVLLWPTAWLAPQPSPYKELSQTLLVPGTRIVAERSSPLGELTVVASPEVPFRYAPGLSLLTGLEPPEQRAVFVDGGGMTAVTRFDGRLEPLAYLDLQTSALPFALRPGADVLILGAGGGADVLLALRSGAERITAVELDPALVALMQGPLAEFSGGLFTRPNVHLRIGEARHFAAVGRDRYDIIQISLLDSFAATASGLRALAESNIYTVEAVSTYLDRLAADGLLAITRWLQTPPRDSLKVFATAVAALERQGVADPARALALINGWRTATVLIKAGPLTADEIEMIRGFAAARGFDVAYLPGGTVEEASRFNRFERPYLFEATRALLGPDRDRFLADYRFDIAPATDDRPYFFRFLKLKTLLDLIALPRQSGINLLEWGYPLLLLTLAQAAIASLVLILLPLAFFRRRAGSMAGDRLFVAVYFGALGLAFLFIEMAFIQRLQVFLGHPIYAVSATLSGFLVFAGFGSGFAQPWLATPARGVILTVAAIALASLIALVAIHHLLPLLAGAGLPARFAAALALIAPLAFVMGMPFPLGLAIVQARARPLLPWAWGVNGCASVLSPLLAALLAIHLGFTAVLVAAIGLYAIAAASLPLARSRR
jgi:hypothetical protein